MKISVIVPVYNVEKYLGFCIESIIQQTHQNVELILVDDGSTDGSRNICEQYQENYPDIIKTVYLKNGGPLRARLVGIEKSAGDVLVFLDSDDCLRKDALNKIEKCFEVHSCDMILYDAGISEDFPSRSIVHSLESEMIFEGDYKYELYKKIIQGEVPNSICLKAFRKECAYFPEYFMDFTMRNGEDLLLSVNFMTNCRKIVYLNEGLYYYRDRQGSAIHTFNFERKDSIKIVHTELEKYIDKWGMQELTPIHNTRKVKGWIYNLSFLIKHRNKMKKNEFKSELVDMSEDDYFRKSYENMSESGLSSYYRLLALCLYKRWYFLIVLICNVRLIIQKPRSRRRL